MMRVMVRALEVLLLAGLVAMTASCGSDLSNDPYLAKELKSIHDEIDKLKDVPMKVQETEDSLAFFQKEIDKLQKAAEGTAPLGLSASVARIEQRLKDIENRLQALETWRGMAKTAVAPTKTTTKLAPTPAPIAAKPTPAPTKPVALRTTPTAAPTTGPVAAAKAAPAKAAKAAGGAARERGEGLPRGRYHNVAAGDTLEALAKSYGVTVDDICNANAPWLTPSSSLRPGETIWIPLAKALR